MPKDSPAISAIGSVASAIFDGIHREEITNAKPRCRQAGRPLARCAGNSKSLRVALKMPLQRVVAEGAWA